MEEAFSKEFLEEQRRKLLYHKSKILSNIRTHEELKVSVDDLQEEVDLSNAIIGQNFAISLKEREIKRLREIDEALMRIENGTYGMCEESGDPIELNRLRKLPWTKFSIESAEELEREEKKYVRAAL